MSLLMFLLFSSLLIALAAKQYDLKVDFMSFLSEVFIYLFFYSLIACYLIFIVGFRLIKLQIFVGGKKRCITNFLKYL